MAERLQLNRAVHQLVVFGLSDRGLQRENNEDHFMVADLTRKLIGVYENQLRPELFHHDIGLRGTILMVADGLGGHEGGEIASQMAVDTVAQVLVETVDHDLPVSERMTRAVDVAHESICKYHGAKGRTRHMASTLTAVHIGEGIITIAQVGDSRAYRFRDGKLTLLTEDQTVVHMMQKKGMLTPEEAQTHPHRNIILQALGQDKNVVPEIQTLPFAHNDCILLCSDGLSSYVTHERIEAIMASGDDEHLRCRQLVEEANAAGGADNVTVLLARLMVKEPSRPEGSGRSPVRGAQRPRELPRTTSQAVPPEEAAEPAVPQEASPAPLRFPWLTRNGKAAGAGSEPTPATPPVHSPAKTPLWKREIRWPWGHKTTSTTPQRGADPLSEASRTPLKTPGGDERVQLKSGHVVQAGWDPKVLKGVEDSLATYIGPVAKILVARAANQTRDFQALCQALATQLATEQERTSFLQSALRQNTSPARRS